MIEQIKSIVEKVSMNGNGNGKGKQNGHNKRKKITIGIVVVFLVFVFYSVFFHPKTQGTSAGVKTVSTQVDKSFEFPALNSAGKPALKDKIKMTITNTDKTNQVSVKDQVFNAKNDKMFLIVNLELKNDATVAYNLLPGDLVRLSVVGDEENKFAPDLHNNLVPVAAISTRIDRIGFVIPASAKQFNLYLGELEGKKEVVTVNFPS